MRRRRLPARIDPRSSRVCARRLRRRSVAAATQRRSQIHASRAQSRKAFRIAAVGSFRNVAVEIAHAADRRRPIPNCDVVAQILGRKDAAAASSASSIGWTCPGRFAVVLTEVCWKITASTGAARSNSGSSCGVWPAGTPQASRPHGPSAPRSG